MDEGCSKAVEEVFMKLYKKGYIYKGSRIINWCPDCQTSISDAEVEHEEQARPFLAHQLPDRRRRRPFRRDRHHPSGNHCLAIPLWQLIRRMSVTKIWSVRMLILPLTDREIPVIADAYVDKEFGTGVCKDHTGP